MGKNKEKLGEKTFLKKGLKIFSIALGVVIIILGFLYWYMFARYIPLDKRFDKKSDQYAFVLPEMKPIKGVGGIKAENCKACHTKIYEEWKQTTHANALSDIQFQAELTKMSSPKWLCLNCHIPLQNQREYFVTDLKAGLMDGNVYLPIKKDNPKFDPKIQKEAITCAVCHVRRDAKGDSYIIGPFGSKKAPHPVKKDKVFLQNICLRCHNPIGEGVTENLLCWFDTKDELTEGQADLIKSYGAKQSCVSCHMPKKSRKLVEFMKNLEVREGKQHSWAGGGIPKWFKDYDNLIARGYKIGLDLKVKKISKKGSTVDLDIMLKNARAGHYLPTADPERFIIVIARVQDNTEKVIAEAKYRIGQDWEWEPARKIKDNRLKQGETRMWSPSLTIKKPLEGHKLTILAIHIKVTSKNAKHMMEAKKVNEKHFPKGQHYVENAINYYPMASFIYKEIIDLTSGVSTKVYSMEELIELSKQEKGKPLKNRDY